MDNAINLKPERRRRIVRIYLNNAPKNKADICSICIRPKPTKTLLQRYIGQVRRISEIVITNGTELDSRNVLVKNIFGTDYGINTKATYSCDNCENVNIADLSVTQDFFSASQILFQKKMSFYQKPIYLYTGQDLPIRM